MAARERSSRAVIGGGRSRPHDSRATCTRLGGLRHAGGQIMNHRRFRVGDGDRELMSGGISVNIIESHRHGRRAESEGITRGRGRRIGGDTTVIRSAVCSPGDHCPTGTGITGEILRSRCSGVSRGLVVGDGDVEGSTGRETIGIV